MATNDFAILVGISEYRSESFPSLRGPLNDVRLVRDWLVNSAGGDVPEENIRTLVTSMPVPVPKPNGLGPRAQDFQDLFSNLVVNAADDSWIQRDGRLYLYLSGHGFSRREDQAPRAALITANGTPKIPENISATSFMYKVRDQALFREVVLIMDCCRDLALNFPYWEPVLNLSQSDNSSQVKVLAIYAGPKAAMTLERPIPERGGNVHGLLTHALFKAIAEANPDNGGNISSHALSQHVNYTWPAICGDTPLDEPEFVLPSLPGINFASGNSGVRQKFCLKQAIASTFCLTIRDSSGSVVVSCSLNSEGLGLISKPGQSNQPISALNSEVELGLQPGLYKYELTGDRTGSGLFEVNGVDNVSI